MTWFFNLSTFSSYRFEKALYMVGIAEKYAKTIPHDLKEIMLIVLGDWNCSGAVYSFDSPFSMMAKLNNSHVCIFV